MPFSINCDVLSYHQFATLRDYDHPFLFVYINTFMFMFYNAIPVYSRFYQATVLIFNTCLLYTSGVQETREGQVSLQTFSLNCYILRDIVKHGNLNKTCKLICPWWAVSIYLVTSQVRNKVFFKPYSNRYEITTISDYLANIVLYRSI